MAGSDRPLSRNGACGQSRIRAIIAESRKGQAKLGGDSHGADRASFVESVAKSFLID